MKPKAIVIGASAGGLHALGKILPHLPLTCPPVAIVQHIPANANDSIARRFDELCTVRVKEAEEKEPLLYGHVYFAPANYHLMIEADKSFSLSGEAPHLFSRPSIDILFQSAAEAFCSSLVGVILTGASSDGADGLASVKALGGLTIVQTPATAETDIMPMAALNACKADIVLPLEEIGPYLRFLSTES
jgi:two-component system chemotaxis response regulator CheB